MRLRVLIGLVLVSLVAASLDAAAQDITVTIVDLAPGPARVNAGQADTQGFSVNVFATGFQCTSAGAILVDLAVTNAGAAPAGVVAIVDPANLSFPVQPGPYGLPGGTPPPAPLPVAAPYNSTLPATLRITTTAAASGTFTASVSASHKAATAGDPGCIGTLPEKSDTKTHQVLIAGAGPVGGNGTSPPGPIGGNNTTGGNETGPPPVEPPQKGFLPGFEPLVAVAAAGLLALASRRRRA